MRLFVLIHVYVDCLHGIWIDILVFVLSDNRCFMCCMCLWLAFCIGCFLFLCLCLCHVVVLSFDTGCVVVMVLCVSIGCCLAVWFRGFWISGLVYLACDSVRFMWFVCLPLSG